jgi:uncharacterized peroxidase-related enzyme
MTDRAIAGPWIRTVPTDEATGVLRDAYEAQAARIGRVTPLTQLGSLYPDLVAERLRLYDVVEATRSAIPDWARRAVALTVSALNSCLFCTAGHSEKLRESGRGALAEAILADPGAAPAGEERVDALLRYARRLTLDPANTTEADVAALRSHGWTDLDILDVNNLAAYYGYINRVASGLGLKGIG